MSCNVPIVSTNVGDVEWLLDGVNGCYIADFNPVDFSKKLSKAIQFSIKNRRTKGRDRILKLGLDSKVVAEKVKGIYEKR